MVVAIIMATRAQALIPIIIAAVIVGIVGLYSIPSDTKLESVEFPRGTIKVDDITLEVQIADDQPRRTRGLMFQDELPLDQGMIFVFEESGRHPLWMLNMQFSLDMIWFDENGKVSHIEENVPPCTTVVEIASCASFASETDAKYILEVTAGFVKANEITYESVLEIISI